MEIKDLAGLSQPLTKLVEVISSGLGNLSESYLIRKKAQAKAFEIDTISKAIRRNISPIANLEYKDQTVTIVGKDENQKEISIEEKFEERLLSRLVFQEVKRQQNIEQISQYAAEQLRDEKEVSSEKIDEDWISRFFNIAEEITGEEAQMLWGKVLAGEVKRPKSYSIRTLEFLKNISKEEAQIFSKIAQLSIIESGKAYIPIFGDEYLKTKFEISVIDILALQEIGILVQRDLDRIIPPADESPINLAFLCGNKCIVVNKSIGTPRQSFRAILYSKIGAELLSLVEIKVDEDYLIKFSKLLITEGVKVQIGDVIEIKSDHIKYENLHEVNSK